MLWSHILALVTSTGLWMAGSQKRAGWVLCTASQFIWVAYALTTRQYGFIIAALAHGVVYVRNWRVTTDEVSAP